MKVIRKIPAIVGNFNTKIPAIVANAEQWVLGMELRLLNGGIRQRRLTRGLTQRELAEKIGIGKAVIGQAETLYNKPSRKTLEKLAAFFDCSPHELWPEWLEPRRPERQRLLIFKPVNEVTFSEIENRLLLLPEDRTNALPEAAAEQRDLREQLRWAISTLSPREEEVISLYFGFDSVPLTLEQVGKQFNVSKERIRQIISKGLRKLRHPYRAKHFKDYLNAD